MRPELTELKALCEKLLGQDLPPVMHNGYTLEEALMAIVDDYITQVVDEGESWVPRNYTAEGYWV